ncbi:MAG: SRPBCC domain-containing protein [Chitinophagaceae bacterium]|nr:SRPBCC domain-containing protein [Chitinophagaceae bacterium]
MNSNLLFDFTVNKENNTVNIKREFNADRELVWEAWTNPEILDQWWAPKPYSSKTKYMNFEVGGRRFYAMVSPEGEEIGWHIQDYTSISPKTNFKFLSVFADKDENPHLPGSDWDLTFSEQNACLPDRQGITTVHIHIYNESRERMEKMIEMGFKEGFTMTLNELDTLLSTLKK